MDGETSDSLPRRQTDPLWIQSHFLATGHHERTPNATATFVQRRGRHYAVTCGHVVDLVREWRDSKGDKSLTTALQIDTVVLNQSYVSPQGVELSIRTPEPELHAQPVDVALAPIAEGHWKLLSERKNKVAIDLDSWREPDWSIVELCRAVGYVNEEKETVWSGGSQKVSTRMAEVWAKLSSALPGPAAPRFALSSELESPHASSLSGMSGGAVYAMEENSEGLLDDTSPVPIGIVHEGYPGSIRPGESNEESSNDRIHTERHVTILALSLTPDGFDDWLRRSGLWDQ